MVLRAVSTSGSSGAGTVANSTGGLFATIGDSQLANGAIKTGNLATINCSPLSWAKVMTGQRIRFPVANSLAVGGTQWPAILATLTDALALNPNFVLINGGTNDAAAGGSLSTAITNTRTAAQMCSNAGVVPIFMPIVPRTFGFTATVGRWIESYNRALLELGFGRPDLMNLANLRGQQRPIVLDHAPFYDYTSTAGGANTGMIASDGLHLAQGGGLIFGQQLADIVNAILPPAPTYISNPYDVYDATNYPAGNLIVSGGVNDGMMRGTGGSLTANSGVTPTGTIGDRYQASAVSVNATATMVLSQENPRLDGLYTGLRTRCVISATGGSGTQTYRIQYVNGINGVNAGFSAGDTVVFECQYEILTATNFRGLYNNLPATGGSNLSYLDNNSYSGGVAGVGTANFPRLAHKGVLRTEPMVIEAGVTRFLPTLWVALMGGSPAGIDFYTSDWKMFKQVTA